MKKPKINKSEKIIIFILTTMTIILLLTFLYTLYFKQNKDNNKKVYYEVIATNNTLDSYNEDIKNNTNTQYIKYYVTKDLDKFVEVKMIYEDGVTTSLNISANTSDDNTEYNFEMTYDNQFLIFEGNTDNNYACHYVVQENVDRDIMDNYCDKIPQELEEFNKQKKEIMNDEKIKEELRK